MRIFPFIYAGLIFLWHIRLFLFCIHKTAVRDENKYTSKERNRMSNFDQEFDRNLSKSTHLKKLMLRVKQSARYIFLQHLFRNFSCLKKHLFSGVGGRLLVQKGIKTFSQAPAEVLRNKFLRKDEAQIRDFFYFFGSFPAQIENVRHTTACFTMQSTKQRCFFGENGIGYRKLLYCLKCFIPTYVNIRLCMNSI